VEEITFYGELILIVSVGLALALVSRRLTEALRVPAPAVFLVAAALATDLFPGIGDFLTIREVERIGVVALIAILFDGGMEIGAARLRGSLWPIAVLGVAGTFGTAAIVAVAAHWLLGFDWTLAWILGAALAPTDPATTFSVLGQREVVGRTGTILKGESGANDPVGIALMLGLIEFATSDGGGPSIVLIEFVTEMAVGLVAGIVGAVALRGVMRTPLPNEGLYPLRTVAAAGIIYGLTSVAHGSGFLAVFVAGILIGDERAPYKAEIERVHASLASLAEIVVFVALGLTINIGDLFTGGGWLDGLVLATVLTFVARPIAVGALLLPADLRRGEKVFLVWSGLKGAVPILLAAFALLSDVAGAQDVYEIVFVVVLLSVLVQGGLVPTVAARAGVAMRTIEPEPWNVSVRLRSEPHGVQRFLVAAGARASGVAIRDLPISERTWISLVVRGGAPVQARGDTVLAPGDELLVLAEGADERALRRLFEEARAAEPGAASP
jgi:cell volume regulation protein A